MWRHRYDVIIFDTQARCTVGMNENDSKSVGEFVHRLEQLRQMYGACLLLIHHMPRQGDHLRGSIAMEGAATTVLLASKEGPQVTITTAKQKDIEAPDPLELQLMPHHKSAVLVEIREGESTLSPTQMALLALVREHHDEWVSKSEVKATAGCLTPRSTATSTT
jgi:RecA-family ATPase